MENEKAVKKAVQKRVKSRRYTGKYKGRGKYKPKDPSTVIISIKKKKIFAYISK